MDRVNQLERKDIPLGEIKCGKINVRKTECDADLDNLIVSIKTIGLLQPVVVLPKDKDGKHELIIGQRRLRAFQKMGEKNIPAVITNKMDDLSAKIASLGENLQRRELPYSDTVKVIGELYKEYKDPQKVADILGVSKLTVLNYLEHQIVPKDAQELVDDKKISRDKMLHLARIYHDKPEKIAETAKKIAKDKMPSSRAKRVIRIAQKKPDADLDTLIKESENPFESIKFSLDISIETHTLLKEAANKESKDLEDIVNEAIEEWLNRKGYAKNK